MTRRILAFEFDATSANALVNMLEEQMYDCVTVTIRHPLTGEEVEVVIPDIVIRVNDCELICQAEADIRELLEKFAQYHKKASEELAHTEDAPVDEEPFPVRASVTFAIQHWREAQGLPLLPINDLPPYVDGAMQHHRVKPLIEGGAGTREIYKCVVSLLNEIMGK